MTRSVAELAKDIERMTGVVTSPQVGDPALMAPPARLLWLRQVLTQLNLDSGFLSAAEALRERASALRQEAVQAAQQAAQRRAAAIHTLGRDNPATLAEAVSQWETQSPWLDSQPNHQSPPALELAESAAKLIEGQIVTQLYGQGERIFALVQKKATELVQQIADLPKFPDQIWGSPDPSTDLARIPAHRLTWGVLTATNQDFLACHDVANMVRDSIGAGVDRMPDGAPRYAFWAKNWRHSLTDDTFPQLKAPLRIRWALDHDWRPGLWRPEDIKTTARDASFGGKLSQLGSAVGVNF